MPPLLLVWLPCLPAVFENAEIGLSSISFTLDTSMIDGLSYSERIGIVNKYHTRHNATPDGDNLIEGENVDEDINNEIGSPVLWFSGSLAGLRDSSALRKIGGRERRLRYVSRVQGGDINNTPGDQISPR